MILISNNHTITIQSSNYLFCWLKSTTTEHLSLFNIIFGPSLHASGCIWTGHLSMLCTVEGFESNFHFPPFPGQKIGRFDDGITISKVPRVARKCRHWLIIDKSIFPADSKGNSAPLRIVATRDKEPHSCPTTQTLIDSFKDSSPCIKCTDNQWIASLTDPCLSFN